MSLRKCKSSLEMERWLVPMFLLACFVETAISWVPAETGRVRVCVCMYVCVGGSRWGAREAVSGVCQALSLGSCSP